MGLHGLRQSAELPQRDQHLSAGLPDLLDNCRAIGVGIGQHHHTADLERGVVGHDHLRHVGQHDHNALPWFDAQAVQRVGELIGLPFELLIGQPGAVEYGRCPFRHVIRRRFQELVERLAGDGDGLRGLFAVALEPGAMRQRRAVGLLAPGDATALTLLVDKALDGAVDRRVALELDLVLGRANVNHLCPRRHFAHLIKNAAGKVPIPLACDDERGRADIPQQRPALPFAHVIQHHPLHDVHLSVPARAIFPPRSEGRCRHPREPGCGARKRILARRRDQDEFLQALRAGVGIFDADGASEGMAGQDESLRQAKLVRYGVYVVNQFWHGVGSEGGVALTVAAQIGRYHAIASRKMVDLVFPRFGAAAIAVHEHDRLFGPFWPDVNHAQRHICQARYGHVHPIEVEIQLDVPVLETTQFSFHEFHPF